MLDRSRIDDIIKNYDIVDFISLILEIKKSGLGFFSKCPFHNENTSSFYISKKSQRYYCFGCHKTGNIINFIMEYKKCNFISALKILSNKNINENNLISYKKKNDIFDYFNKMLINKKKININNFLELRGINLKSIIKFKLGIIKLESKNIKNKNIEFFLSKIGILHSDRFNLNQQFKHRLIIPIRDLKGEYIGIGGRTIYNNVKPKYINSSDSEFFSKKKSFYGIYEAREYKENLIIVEGYFDVIKLHQFEIKNVVAILGTALSKEHLVLLKSLCKRITFCFDGDTAGKLAAIKSSFMCIPFLLDFKAISVSILPDGFDPDSFITLHGKNNFIKLLNNSIFLIDFIFLSMNIKTTELNFFSKLNKVIENSENFLLKNFIFNYSYKYFYFKQSNITTQECVIPLFIKACIFLIKKRYLIYKISFKKIANNKNIFFNKEIRFFLDLCFLIKNNLNIKYIDLNKRFINKINLKYSNLIILINKMPIEVLNSEFLSIIKKIESYIF